MRLAVHQAPAALGHVKQPSRLSLDSSLIAHVDDEQQGSTPPTPSSSSGDAELFVQQQQQEQNTRKRGVAAAAAAAPAPLDCSLLQLLSPPHTANLSLVQLRLQVFAVKEVWATASTTACRSELAAMLSYNCSNLPPKPARLTESSTGGSAQLAEAGAAQEGAAVLGVPTARGVSALR